MPNVSNDLSQKLYATMEKHKEVRWCLQEQEKSRQDFKKLPTMAGMYGVSPRLEIQNEEVI